MNLPKMPLCWICSQNKADSGEHIIQASDIGRSFNLKKGDPFFIHNEDRKNFKIQSIKSDHLKFSKVICSHCNSTRTQPHDRAWENLSKFLNYAALSADQKIRFNRPFPYDTGKFMRDVQLHFVKKIGCAIAEHQIPIDISTFSNAILENKCHPNIYLAFGTRPLEKDSKSLVVSDFHVWKENEIGVVACWPLFFKEFTVMVMYALKDGMYAGQTVSWNPRFNTNCTTIINIDKFMEENSND